MNLINYLSSFSSFHSHTIILYYYLLLNYPSFFFLSIIPDILVYLQCFLYPFYLLFFISIKTASSLFRVYLNIYHTHLDAHIPSVSFLKVLISAYHSSMISESLNHLLYNFSFFPYLVYFHSDIFKRYEYNSSILKLFFSLISMLVVLFWDLIDSILFKKNS